MDYGIKTRLASVIEGSKNSPKFFLYFRNSRVRVVVYSNGDLAMKRGDFIQCLNDDEENVFPSIFTEEDMARSWEDETIAELHEKLFASCALQKDDHLESRADFFWEDFVGVLHLALRDYLESKFSAKLEARAREFTYKKRKLDDMLEHEMKHSGSLYSNFKKPRKSDQ